MTEFRVKVRPEQKYRPHREVAVYVGRAGDPGPGAYCGSLTMRAEEAAAFAACFDELALSREILTEDVLDAAAAVLSERNGADALLAQYETARDRATEGTT